MVYNEEHKVRASTMCLEKGHYAINTPLIVLRKGSLGNKYTLEDMHIHCAYSSDSI
jgi:hypothetical protein